jgi:DNA invertase Pin-like site-specific DNA recombinase
MLISSARVSTNDQTLNLQLDSLKVAGCEKIFTSGTKSADTSALRGLPGAPAGQRKHPPG